MSDYSDIRYAVKDGVARILLARPSRLNALTPQLLAQMADALDRLEADGARVLVLQGEGRAFSSGADLQAEPGEAALAEDLGQLLEDSYNPVLRRLHGLPIPIVASVQGAAAGAGCSLALAADFVVAGASAYFLLAFVNIGLVPDAGVTWILPRLVGQSRALEMMMLGERIRADKAEAWGLIHRAVADEVLEAETEALAARLAAGPTVAHHLIRTGVRAAQFEAFDDSLHRERVNQGIAGRTADFAEGVAAFTERRSAHFGGR